MDIVNVNSLYKKYKNKDVLKDINFSLEEGKIYGFIGENGAGKTTLMRILTGLSKQNSGTVKLFNNSKTRKCIGAIIESPALNIELSAYENIKYKMIMNNIKDFSQIEKLLEKVNLKDVKKKKVKDFSLGMRQRIALARALIKKPSFLILDEATSNLDFISEAKIFDTLFKKGKNVTMLMIAHRLSTIRSCDIIYVMDKGKIVEEGTHESLLKEKGHYYKLYVSQVGSLEERDNIFSDEEVCDIEEKKIIMQEEVIEDGEEYEYN